MINKTVIKVQQQRFGKEIMINRLGEEGQIDEMDTKEHFLAPVGRS